METEGPAVGKPPGGQQGPVCRPRATKGGGDAVNGIGFRHMEWGTETSGRGWRVAVVVNFQVDDVPLRERRWGAGVTERCYNK